MQFIIFKIANFIFGIQQNCVYKIMPVPEMKEIDSDVPDYFYGYFDFRGEVIPAIELGTKLNIARERPYSDRRVLLTDINNIRVALLADKVLHILSVSEDELFAHPTNRYIKNDIIQMVLTDKKSGAGVVFILDEENIFTSADCNYIKRVKS